MDTYSFKYILPEAAKKKDKNKDKESKKAKSDDYEAFKEAVRDTKTTWLAKLPADAKETKVNFELLSYFLKESSQFDELSSNIFLTRMKCFVW